MEKDACYGKWVTKSKNGYRAVIEKKSTLNALA
jgi:hypothetical protein